MAVDSSQRVPAAVAVCSRYWRTGRPHVTCCRWRDVACCERGAAQGHGGEAPGISTRAAAASLAYQCGQRGYPSCGCCGRKSCTEGVESYRPCAPATRLTIPSNTSPSHSARIALASPRERNHSSQHRSSLRPTLTQHPVAPTWDTHLEAFQCWSNHMSRPGWPRQKGTIPLSRSAAAARHYWYGAGSTARPISGP
jgi:hypothetical protein